MRVLRTASVLGSRLILQQNCRKQIWPILAQGYAAKARGAVELTDLMEANKDVTLIRNIGISAHIDSGKTTLTERILFYTGVIEEMHEVRGKDKVGATMDFMDLERQRGITIQSAATYTNWKGTDINIIDTPGHIDFTVEVERALRVLDGAIMVLCAVGGVQSQTFTVNRQMTRYNVPRIAFINKLDRQGANAYRVLEQMRKKLQHNAAFVNIPIGQGYENEGIIDLITKKALYFDEPQGLVIREEEIPEEYEEEVEERRQEMIEHVANVDEVLGDIFLEEREPTEEEIMAAIRRACIKQLFTPVFTGTALKNRGVQPLLNGVVNYLPNPTEVENYALKDGVGDEETPKIKLNPAREEKPFIGLAFKLEAGKYGQLTYVRAYEGHLKKGMQLINTRTQEKVRIPRIVRMHADKMQDVNDVYAGDIIALFRIDCASGDTFVSAPELKYISCESMHVPAPVISMSITPCDRESEENFYKGVNRYMKEDPTFKVIRDLETNQVVVTGMGELHLEIYQQRLESEYNCRVKLGSPKVAYLETLSSDFVFNYFHKRQSGGRGEYGRVIGTLEPLPPAQNDQLKFVDATVGTNIPKNFMPGIQKGFKAMCEKGPLTANRVAGIRFRLEDGAHHPVDSSDWAFQQAAMGAMQQAYDEGSWMMLEPIMAVEVYVPPDLQGQAMNSITSRHGQITDTEQTAAMFTLYAEVPLSQMVGYIRELRGFTAGQGEFSMEFKRYAPAIPSLESQLIQEYEAQKEQSKKGGAEQTKKKKKYN